MNGMKREVMNENATNLWHKMLGHILKERMEWLVKDKILPILDATNFGV